MGDTTKIDYFLPITKARLAATVTTVTDTLAGADSREATRRLETSRTFSLVTVADQKSPRTLSVDRGMWQDYSFELDLTEDGRIVTLNMKSAGRAGVVLATGVTVAAAAAALAIGHVPAAAALAALVPRIASQARPAEEALAEFEAEPEEAHFGPVWEAYRQEHPADARRIERLAVQVAATEERIDQARDDLRNAIADPAKRADCRRQLAILRALLGDLDTDLGDRWQSFATWRESTLTRTAWGFDELLSLDELPRLVNRDLNFGDDDRRQKARHFWANTGWILATVDEPAEQAAPAARPAPAAELLTRRPRPVVLAHVQEVNGETVPVQFDRVMAMDGHCLELVLPLKASKTAKRHTTVKLSPQGALTSVGYGGTSSAAADAAAAGAIAEGLAGQPGQ